MLFGVGNKRIPSADFVLDDIISYPTHASSFPPRLRSPSDQSLPFALV
jgi:hypothetical protein